MEFAHFYLNTRELRQHTSQDGFAAGWRANQQVEGDGIHLIKLDIAPCFSQVIWISKIPLLQVGN